MLASLENLQHLSIGVILDRRHCPRPSRFRPLIPSSTIHDGRRVPVDILQKFRTNPYLRNIKGLASLNLDFMTSGYELLTGKSGPYFDLQQDLKRDMLANK